MVSYPIECDLFALSRLHFKLNYCQINTKNTYFSVFESNAGRINTIGLFIKHYCNKIFNESVLPFAFSLQRKDMNPNLDFSLFEPG